MQSKRWLDVVHQSSLSLNRRVRRRSRRKVSVIGLEQLEDRTLLTAPHPVDLGALTGSNGFTLTGSAANDASGHSVSSAGDVNGDGYVDFIVGAPFATVGAHAAAGQSHLVFGKASGFTSSLDLSTLSAGVGMRFDGPSESDTSGLSVSAAGDVNGDGYDDLIIGAPRGSVSPFATSDFAPRSASHVYVFFGASTGWGSSADLSLLTVAGGGDGSRGFVINGDIDSNENLGISVSGAGDVNGDGYADLIVGAPGVLDASVSGKAYVIFGTGLGFPAELNVSDLLETNGGNGTQGFIVHGIDQDSQTGISVSGGGDVNGDGYDDLLVGASSASPGGKSEAGESYVVFGHSDGFAPSLYLATLDGTNGFALDGIDAADQSGFSVSLAGDINGDGFDDILIGAHHGDVGANSDAGESYVVFGKASSFGASVDLSSLDGTTGFRIDGVAAGDRSGFGVRAAGDVDGDGFDDLIIGAPTATPSTPSYAGASYVLFGQSSSFGSNINLSTLTGTTGFRLDGAAANDYSGLAVGSAGDINGDGFDDVIVGAPYADPGAVGDAGESYVVFGGSFTGGVETQTGTGAAETLTAIQGSGAADILIGGQNDDSLIGDGGPDVLQGGQGNDLLSVPSVDFQRVVGGRGSDTLAIDGANITLDLTTLADNKLTGVEVIDLTGSGPNTLKLTELEVLNISNESNRLIVLGDLDDTIAVDPSWTDAGYTTIDGRFLRVLSSGSATLAFSPALRLQLDYDLPEGVGIYRLSRSPSGQLQLAARSGAAIYATDYFFESVVFNGTAGDDILIVDFANGDPIPVGGMTFNGGAEVLNGDKLQIEGDPAARPFQLVTYSVGGPDSGSIDFDGSFIAYTGLEPVSDNTQAVNRVFSVPATSTTDYTINLTDDSAALGHSSINDGGTSLFESVSFSNPTERLFIISGGGNDQITFVSADLAFRADVIFDGGAGNDVIDGGGSPFALTLNGATGNDTMTGSGWDDLLLGGAGNDCLLGGDGQDTLKGEDGDDTLSGGEADDRLAGNAGNDSVGGDEGVDFLNGGLGNDTMDGGSGDDLLFGGAGRDSLSGGAGYDTLRGQGSSDTLAGGDEADRVDGGLGDDVLSGNAGDDTVNGGQGDDAIAGEDGDDALMGGSGNDTIDGGAGEDYVKGHSGNDQLSGSDGDDTLKGSGGTDTLSETADVNFVLTDTALTGLGTDVLVSLEQTMLTGGAAGNSIDAQAFSGSATIDGSAGLDTIIGSAGNDSIIGGDGDDSIQGGSGNDTISGDAGNDTLKGGDDDDVLNGGDGDDILNGGDGDDSLAGDAGDDSLSGWSGADWMNGGTGSDRMLGGTQNDLMFGGSGNDTLLGNANSDTLKGHGGTDTVAGRGNYIANYDADLSNSAADAGDKLDGETIDEAFTIAAGWIDDV